MVSQLEQDIINSNIKNFVYEIDWLNPLEQVIGNVAVDVFSGNANFDDTNSNKRSVDLSLVNFDKSYIPFESTKMQINNKVRLKCGYKSGTNKIMYNKGIYVLGNPSVLSNPSQKEVTLQILDKWVLLDGTISGKLKNKYIIPVGSRVDEVVKDLIVDISGEIKYIIDECSEVLPYSITKPMGTPVSEILEEIGNIVVFESYFDNDGIFRFRKNLNIDDLQTLPVSWYYTTSGIYLGSARELDWNAIKNSIKVVGMTLENGTVCQAISQDTNINSRFSIQNIGERFEPIEDDNIFSNELALLRSNYELQQRIMVNEKVQAITIPNFSLNTGDVINIVDENNGCNSNYLIQSIDFNFGHDSVMNLGLFSLKDWR